MSLRKYQGEEPLKNSQIVNKMHIPNSSYLKSFKKSVNSRENIRIKTEASNRSMYSEASSKSNIKARPSFQIKRKPAEQNRQFQYLMRQTDNSMQELLNSSINQFEKLIIKQDEQEGLEEQNYRLKSALAKMKNVLKVKLESALQKQKDELSKMLEDYISLITKLLEDKEELTIALQDLQEQKYHESKKVEQQWSKKMKNMMQEHDQQMSSTKAQIEDFLKIIEEYEEEAHNQQNKFAELNQKIETLQQENRKLKEQVDHMHNIHSSEIYEEDQSLRIEAQSTKIQTLLELLEKSQAEKNQLIEQLGEYKQLRNNKDNSISYTDLNQEIQNIKKRYEARVQELEDEHQEQFLEYEKAIKDTLVKKDECIERLNLIINGLRERERQH